MSLSFQLVQLLLPACPLFSLPSYPLENLDTSTASLSRQVACRRTSVAEKPEEHHRQLSPSLEVTLFAAREDGRAKQQYNTLAPVVTWWSALPRRRPTAAPRPCATRSGEHGVYPFSSSFPQSSSNRSELWPAAAAQGHAPGRRWQKLRRPCQEKRKATVSQGPAAALEPLSAAAAAPGCTESRCKSTDRGPPLAFLFFFFTSSSIRAEL